ncbi:hypothetical protein G6F63_015123 [Rhizopus arrhizus]|nr:hypothetical protein G6F63_015123 [Rhizopus arrhizus]
MGGAGHAQHAACARHVVHDDRLVQPFGQLLRNQTRRGVHVAARAERHDQGQRLRARPGRLGTGGRGDAQRGRQHGHGQEQAFEHSEGDQGGYARPGRGAPEGDGAILRSSG